jgi:hypothetical protein
VTRTIYRDRKTGRFSSKSTWKRSKAKGGDRYVRQRVKVKVKAKKRPPLPPPEEREIYEWIVAFTYEDSGKTFDVIVTARDSEEAQRVALEFLRTTPQGRNITRAGLSGWNVDVARGVRSDEEAGEAEYRSKSRQ